MNDKEVLIGATAIVALILIYKNKSMIWKKINIPIETKVGPGEVLATPRTILNPAGTTVVSGAGVPPQASIMGVATRTARVIEHPNHIEHLASDMQELRRRENIAHQRAILLQRQRSLNIGR